MNTADCMLFQISTIIIGYGGSNKLSNEIFGDY